MKEGIITVLVTHLDTVLKEQLTAVNAFAFTDKAQMVSAHKRIFQQLPMKRLIGFEVVLKHDICTGQCKELRSTTAILIFKIAGTSPLTTEVDNKQSGSLGNCNQIAGGFTEKRIECTLEELSKLRAELARIQEHLTV